MKGRKKGQTKRQSKIKDELLYPYEIWMDEDQYTLMDVEKAKPMGFYTNMAALINKMIKLNIANKKETYTLVGFLESYNNVKEELLKPFKNK